MYCKSLVDVVNSGLCISCGTCVSINSDEHHMVEQKGILLPQNPSKMKFQDIGYSLCPGKGYEIIKMGAELFKVNSSYDVELGYYLSHLAIRYSDSEFKKNASSGAIMTGLANYCLKNKIVDGVVTTKFAYTKNGPITKSFIALNEKELISSQGSKYLPVPLFEILPEILDFSGKLLLIGTPCQIASLRLLQRDNSDLKNKIIFTIGNFCGGFRDYRETHQLASLSGINFNEMKSFRYRGNGQPGSMLMEDQEKAIELKYPEYSRLTGLPKYKRCRLCVDATAELADISCGDAWLPRFIESGNAWSLVIIRNPLVKRYLDEMKDLNLVATEPISLEELKLSQKDNLNSKKRRQNTRMKLYKTIGAYIPQFDGGFRDTNTSVFTEIRVLLQTHLFHVLERLGIYLWFARLIKRAPHEEI